MTSKAAAIKPVKGAEIMTFLQKSRYRPDSASVFSGIMDDHTPGWLKKLRQEGLEHVHKAGLPTPRLERWKYTNIIPKVKDFGAALGASDVMYKDPDNIVKSLREVFENAPEWLIEFLGAPPAAARYHDMALWDLCNAYLRDGLMIDVPAGLKCERPVEITISGADGTFFVPRTVFRLGEGSDVTVIEYHRGEGRYWNNRLTQIIVGPNARLRHYRFQECPHEAVYTQNTQVEVMRDGTYETFTLAAGAGLGRNQIHAILSGQNATCNVYGINLLRGSQHGDTTAEVEHKAPHCTSSQFLRSIIDDQARCVFQGKVYVHKGADQTDGSQLSNALLLSEGAEMDTKPELEIYADDVKCGHGATTGRLEEEPIFYLRSRGLDEAAARMLLIEAFVGEVVDRLGDEAVQDMVRERVRKWFN